MKDLADEIERLFYYHEIEAIAKVSIAPLINQMKFPSNASITDECLNMAVNAGHLLNKRLS